MLAKFLTGWITTTCISYTLIQVLFAVCTALIEVIGPVSPTTSALLLLMCVLIAVWTTFLRAREWRHNIVCYLLCYAGCLSIVLGIGQWTGYIPLDEGDMVMTWIVLSMITAVFIGTLAFSVLLERGTATRINARLNALRRSSAEDRRAEDGREDQR